MEFYRNDEINQIGNLVCWGIDHYLVYNATREPSPCSIES
jgi:hypothetical protein